MPDIIVGCCRNYHNSVPTPGTVQTVSGAQNEAEHSASRKHGLWDLETHMNLSRCRDVDQAFRSVRRVAESYGTLSPLAHARCRGCGATGTTASRQQEGLAAACPIPKSFFRRLSARRRETFIDESSFAPGSLPSAWATCCICLRRGIIASPDLGAPCASCGLLRQRRRNSRCRPCLSRLPLS